MEGKEDISKSLNRSRLISMAKAYESLNVCMMLYRSASIIGPLSSNVVRPGMEDSPLAESMTNRTTIVRRMPEKAPAIKIQNLFIVIGISFSKIVNRLNNNK